MPTFRLFDLSGPGFAIPLQLARAAGREPDRDHPVGQVVSCSVCGVRYAARPKGSYVPEDGRCREHAQEATTPKGEAALPLVAPFRRRARGRR